MVRALGLVMLLASTASAKPYIAMDDVPPPVPVTTYISNEESVGEIISHGRWTEIGMGLAVTRTLVGRLELDLEGSVMRLDSSDDNDKSHGYGFHAGGALGYRFTAYRFEVIDFGVEPQIGAGVAETVTTMHASQHEVFAGIKGSFRVQTRKGETDHFGEARSLGGHLTLRLTRAEQHFAVVALIGYDWGL